MYFYLIGTDYKAAPFRVRVDFYRRRAPLADFWRTKGAALLSTCNRIEIYAAASDADTAFGYLAEFSRCFPDFFRYAYLRYGEKEVFRHTLRLASGLESQLEGESEILAQLETWLRQGLLPPVLRGPWERALVLSGDIRRRAGLDKDTDNIAKVIFYDLKQRSSRAGKSEAIVIGTGKIAQLLAQSRRPDLQLNFAAHKNYQRAKELAMISGGRAILFKDLAPALAEADALISATASPHYILSKAHFLSVRRPFYIYDLGLPPDIEPAAGDLPGVFLQDMEGLAGVIRLFNRRNRDKIRLANRLAEEITEGVAQAAYVQNN